MNRFHRRYCASDRWDRALRGGMLRWAMWDMPLGDHALEIGPGPGLTTAILREQAQRLTSLEIDPELAATVAARFPDTNVDVREGDGTAMPFEDGLFSTAISMTMLHHVVSEERQDALFTEAARVLRPGGAFVGCDSIPSFRWRLYHLFDTCTPVDPGTLTQRLIRAGFKDIHVETARNGFRFRARKPGEAA